MENFNVSILSAFILYTLVMISIGVYFYKKNKDTDSYLLGGRKIGPMVSAISAGSSDMSAWLLLGLPGYMYSSGMVSIWIAIGLLIGALVNWSIVAKRLRIYTELLNNSITISEYLKNRFNDNKSTINIISSIVILIFYAVYVASGLIGGAKLFESIFGLDYTLSLLIGATIILSYTLLGGYTAVCWTDFIQGLLMMTALIVVPVIVAINIGGVDKAIAITPKELLNPFHNLSFIGIISLLAWGLGYFGQPHILVRFMSINSKDKIKKARFIGMSWMSISMIGALSVGFFAISYYNMSPLKDGEKAFIYLSQTLFSSFTSGILLSAILAAIMSTISSQLLVSSSSIANDLYILIRKNRTNKEMLIVSRVSVIVVMVIAILISLKQNSTILSIVSHAWAGFGASFGPLILFTLYYKKCSKAGAIAGIISGAFTVIVYPSIASYILSIYEIVPGFIVSSIFIFIFSKLYPPSDKVINTYNQISKQF